MRVWYYYFEDVDERQADGTYATVTRRAALVYKTLEAALLRAYRDRELDRPATPYALHVCDAPLGPDRIIKGDDIDLVVEDLLDRDVPTDKARAFDGQAWGVQADVDDPAPSDVYPDAPAWYYYRHDGKRYAERLPHLRAALYMAGAHLDHGPPTPYMVMDEADGREYDVAAIRAWHAERAGMTITVALDLPDDAIPSPVYRTLHGEQWEVEGEDE